MNSDIAEGLKHEGFHAKDLIGSGCFGYVYTVSWEKYPGQLFAAKIILLDPKMEEVKRSTYNAEIGSLSCLFHPNIIKIYKFFEISNYLVIILEYCPYGNLKEFVTNNENISAGKFLNIAQQCIMALGFCHQKGICHLDIKLENIFIGEHNTIKLADFGLAILNKEHDQKVNMTQGSKVYFSPERFSNAPYDPMKADVWALGVTFYYLITRQYPWMSFNVNELMKSITEENVQFTFHGYPAIQDLVNKMLNKNPTERPSCEEMINLDIFKMLTRSYNDMLSPRGILQCCRRASLSPPFPHLYKPLMKDSRNKGNAMSIIIMKNHGRLRSSRAVAVNNT